MRIKSSRAREEEGKRSEKESWEEGISERRTGRIVGRVKRELNYVLISRPFRKRVSRDAIHQISGAIYILNWRLLATWAHGGSVVGANATKSVPAAARLRICTKNRGPRDHGVTNARIPFSGIVVQLLV